jgi:hypothetical protein
MQRNIIFQGVTATTVRLNKDKRVYELIEWVRAGNGVIMLIIRHMEDGYEITRAANTPGEQRTATGNDLSILLTLLGIDSTFDRMKYRGPFEMDYLSLQADNLTHLGYENVEVVQ